MSAIGSQKLTRIKIHLLPGGLAPKRQTAGAIGFDVAARVVVSPFKMDPDQPHLRKTLFDFHNKPTKRKIRRLVQMTD